LMIIDILNSEQDVAGVNIRRTIDKLIDEQGRAAFPLFDGNEVTFHTSKDRIIHTDASQINPDADLVIVVSRHSSVNPVPVLTVHPAGNYGVAQLGGNDGELARCLPAWMKAVLQNEAKFVPEGYRVSYEITHHGPTDFPVPSFFVEVGSTLTEWNDERAYTAVAKSVLYARPESAVIPLIGFGGTHYAARQTAIALETKGGFGHIMHSRDVGAVTRDIVAQMAEKSGGVLAAHIDRKAMTRDEAARIDGILQTLGIPELTEGELGDLNHMSLACRNRYLAYAKSIDPALKLHRHGEIPDGTPAKICLPADLFSLAFGKDDHALMSWLDATGGIFHTTGQSGKLMPIFLSDEKKSAELSVNLIGLSIQYITRTWETMVDNDTLTVVRRQFDPRLARTLGVPSGPLFGKLASGSEVTLADGKVITPDMVTTVTKTSIKIPKMEN
ncbi:MAG TPA: D-tyrosyl-tRNA(Tyr) deacylase, partial [Methanocorpusculum sp.]|nr:D-tyrosyl-tRNA(Tyr) deacylase [Methanocorpusculum sp.]